MKIFNLHTGQCIISQQNSTEDCNPEVGGACAIGTIRSMTKLNNPFTASYRTCANHDTNIILQAILQKIDHNTIRPNDYIDFTKADRCIAAMARIDKQCNSLTSMKTIDGVFTNEECEPENCTIQYSHCGKEHSSSSIANAIKEALFFDKILTIKDKDWELM